MQQDQPPSYRKKPYKYSYYHRPPDNICYLDKDVRFTRFLGNDYRCTSRYSGNSFKKIGAGGIIINTEGKLLIVKGMSKWSLPKGHLEPGEKYHECAMREIQEEVNLKVHLSITDRYIDVKKCVYFIVVLTETDQLDLKTNDPNEISEVRWASIEEIFGLDCNRQLDYVINRWGYIQSIIESSWNRFVRYPVPNKNSDEIVYCGGAPLPQNPLTGEHPLLGGRSPSPISWGRISGDTPSPISGSTASPSHMKRKSSASPEDVVLSSCWSNGHCVA